MADSPNLPAVREYLTTLQDTLCAALETEDGRATFSTDKWSRAEGGGGRTRILADGAVFEKAGVAFSHVRGTKLPPSATAHRPELAGKPWEALGVSVVLHQRNPYAPTAHANVRFFIAGHTPLTTNGIDSPTPALTPETSPPAPLSPRDSPPSTLSSDAASPAAPRAKSNRPIWWFGGGFDLTPYYGFEGDAVHWHRT